MYALLIHPSQLSQKLFKKTNSLSLNGLFKHGIWWLMLENEFPSLRGVIAFQKPLLHEFSSPSWLLGFPYPFTFMPKEILAKGKFNVDSPRFKPITMPMSHQCTTTQPIHVS